MTENEPRKKCVLETCERPAVEVPGLTVCTEHRAYFDASYERDEWTICAEDLLPLFILHAEQLGNGVLEDLLRENLERATREAKRQTEELERMSARLFPPVG